MLIKKIDENCVEDETEFEIANIINLETGELHGLSFENEYTPYRKQVILNLKTEKEIIDKFSIDLKKHKKEFSDFNEDKYKKELIAIIRWCQKTSPDKMTEKLWESAPTFWY